MSNVAFVVLGLFWSFLSVEGICNSFATKCSMSLGQVWGGNQPIVLPAQGGYYLTFTVSSLRCDCMHVMVVNGAPSLSFDAALLVLFLTY